MKENKMIKIVYGILYIAGMYLLLSVSDGIVETILQFVALVFIIVSLEGVELCNKNDKYR